MAPQRRNCEICHTHMRPGEPRRTLGDGRRVCEACEKDPQRARVSAGSLRTAAPAYDTLYSRSHPRAPLKDKTPVVDYNQALHNYLHQMKVPHECATVAALRFEAHDSGDGATIYHCPFCGSGQVTGGFDGTVTCDFCGNHFTVQVQPEFASMPQTVDGTPYPMPGMPGSTTDTAPGAQAEDDVQDAQDQAQQQPGPGQPPGQPMPPDPTQQQPPPPQMVGMVGTVGGMLPFHQAVAHYALRHAGDNRSLVLSKVRAEQTEED